MQSARVEYETLSTVQVLVHLASHLPSRWLLPAPPTGQPPAHPTLACTAAHLSASCLQLMNNG